MNPCQAVAFGENVYDANVKHYFARYAAYVSPRHAAAHGTVCGECFKDVCMHLKGLVMSQPTKHFFT